jgi:glutamyl-tRNA synthetase
MSFFMLDFPTLGTHARTRLAPSPTGALHLGNARTFLVNWVLARQNGWRVLLRIEDLDGPRIKPESAQQAIADLQWLGIDWDEGPIYQTSRRSLYAVAVERLLRDGLAYPCICTRKDIECAASAPHAEDGAAIYPGTCRGRFPSVAEAQAFAGRSPAIRFAVPDETVAWNDHFAGPQQYQVARQLGDFVVAKADGTPAYQLSVVVDDLDAGVTHVVRGDDLLDSTPRQILLYRALNAPQSIPSYFHLPLIKGPDGLRLAKRHGDSRLSHYRSLGVPAARVLGLLADWCNLSPSGSSSRKSQAASDSDNRALVTLFDHLLQPRLELESQCEFRSAKDLLGRFEMTTMSKHPIIHTKSAEAYLLK